MHPDFKDVKMWKKKKMCLRLNIKRIPMNNILKDQIEKQAKDIN